MARNGLDTMLKQIYLQPTLRGTACLPASKSISNRVLLLDRMAGGTCRITNLSDADDTRVLADALERAAGGGSGETMTIDIGAAGTAMRFLTAYLATRPGRFRLTGSARMRQRPIGILVEALRSLGADIRYCGEEGFPPLEIYGRGLRGGRLGLPAGVSSQYVSALLMTAPALEGADLELTLEGTVASRPYIDMTLALMREFGGEAAWATPDRLRVGRKPYGRTTPFEVEADWSAASYWYELVALCPDAEAEVLLPGLRAESVQGDARVSQLFRPLGVATRFTERGAVLTKAEHGAEPFEADLAQQPDLAQALVATCAMQRRAFRISGLRSLRIKETDRIAAMQAELGRLGVRIEACGDDTMTYVPAPDSTAADGTAGEPLRTYDDHRMAMCLAPCAYRHPGLRIAEPGVVTKSYPGFWDELKRFEQP